MDSKPASGSALAGAGEVSRYHGHFASKLISMRLSLPAATLQLPWLSQLLPRVGLLWPLKAVGTMLFMLVFFSAYFAVLENPLGSVQRMPLTAIDHWLPFTPLAFPFYVSLWVYVSLAPALIEQLRALLRFGVWMGLMCVLCLAIFWLWPTAVPDPGIDWSAYPQMAIIKSVDGSGNACPSLHVASALFAALWFGQLLRQMRAPPWLRLLNWILCLLILWSTIATRQHVALDVVAGALVGVLFGLVSRPAKR